MLGGLLTFWLPWLRPAEYWLTASRSTGEFSGSHGDRTRWLLTGALGAVGDLWGLFQLPSTHLTRLSAVCSRKKVFWPSRESNPGRRGQAARRYLRPMMASISVTTWGWSGAFFWAVDMKMNLLTIFCQTATTWSPLAPPYRPIKKAVGPDWSFSLLATAWRELQPGPNIVSIVGYCS